VEANKNVMATPALTALPPAVVLGLDTLQGLQTARILAGHGIPVIAIARNAAHPACHTRICREIIVAETSGEELVRTLAQLGARLAVPAVLFPCHDHAVATVSQHRQQLTPWYRIALAEADTVSMLMDKASLYAFARPHGFRVPESHTLHDRREATAAADRLRYPCLLKPAHRSTCWNAHTGAKAFQAESREDFLRIYDEVHGWAAALVAQEWIPGDDSALYSVNCYFDKRARLVASFVARKLRQWPPRTGSSCLGEEVRNDTVRNEALRLLELCGYRGLAYVEMKRHAQSGEHYLIEVNVGRPTGRSAIAEAGGVEMLYAMYCDAAGLPPPAVREQSYQGVKWLDLRHDLQSALYYWRRGELTPGQWWRSLRGRKAHAVWSWNDPAPFFWDLWRAVRMAASRKGPADEPQQGREDCAEPVKASTRQ